MNRDRIMGLRSGSEMNRIVAREFMGWTDIQKDARGRMSGFCHYRKKNFLVPNYSGSLNAAWAIVERLKRLRYEIQVNEYGQSPPQVTLFDAHENWVTVDSRTLPEAICKAALLTKVWDRCKQELELEKAISNGKVTCIEERRRTKL